MLMLPPKLEKQWFPRRTTCHVKRKKRQLFGAQLEKQEVKSTEAAEALALQEGTELVFVTPEFHE